MSSSVVEASPRLYGLPPIADDRSRVLILGSFPSEASLRAQVYYAHPRNHFWPIMENLFGIDQLSSYPARTERLLESRVAVWDVIHSCRRRGSADQAIQEAEANGLIPWLDEHEDVLGVAFNGGKAEETAKRCLPELFRRRGVEFKRLPSTSPANASATLARKVEVWRQIKRWAESDAVEDVRE